MLAKLRLDQTKTYEQSIAALEIAEMLVAFVHGRKHSKCLGIEQGIERWDDLVVIRNDGLNDHIQVKRQTTDFSNDPCKRDRYERGGRIGELKDLSPLDQSMKSLAEWTKNTTTSDITRQFTLVLPIDSTQIKDSLQTRHFQILCFTTIKEITTVTGLQELAKVDKTIEYCFLWLTTWCGFLDWNHILRSLKLLKLKLVGLESDINDNTLVKLSDVFNDPENVLREIKSYIIENSTYTGSIAPRQLLKRLSSFLLPEIRTWTQCENEGSIWKISGIHDLESNDQIERPAIIVPLLWGNERFRELKINSATVGGSFFKPHEELFQLALHLKGTVSSLCVSWSRWNEYLKGVIGGTLGTDYNDFNNLSIANNDAPYEIDDALILDTRFKQEEFASELSNEMIQVTCQLVDKELNALIDEMDISNCCELRNAIETRWNIWKQKLGSDIQKQKSLFEKMLHPNAEGNEIIGKLRIGPKTSNLIASGIFLLLIVSVALNEANDDWSQDANGNSIEVIGLKYWSGPSGERKKVREIDDDLSVNELIGKESSDILIISKSSLPESDIYNESIADGSSFENSLAADRRPKLLVTNSRIFKQLISKGEIQCLKDFLMNVIKMKVESTTETINGVVS